MLIQRWKHSKWRSRHAIIVRSVDTVSHTDENGGLTGSTSVVLTGHTIHSFQSKRFNIFYAVFIKSDESRLGTHPGLRKYDTGKERSLHCVYSSTRSLAVSGLFLPVLASRSDSSLYPLDHFGAILGLRHPGKH